MSNVTITNVFGVDWFTILEVIAVIVIGFTLAWLIRMTLYKLLIRALPHQLSKTISRITYYILLLLVILTVLGVLGIDLTGVLVAGGIIGIILGFALQNTVANLFSGLFLLWEKPFRTGDIIRIGDVEGSVVDISIMSTKIRGLDGVVVRVPNQTVFQSNIVNYTGSVARRIEFRIGIAYSEDAEKAYNVLREVVTQHPYVLVKPEPEIFVVELGSSSVDIIVRVWVPNTGLIPWIVRRELLWRMKKALDDAGIEIPFIQTDIWFRTPLKVEVVKKQD